MKKLFRRTPKLHPEVAALVRLRVATIKARQAGINGRELLVLVAIANKQFDYLEGGK